MARELTPGLVWPGQKRQHGTGIFCSNYDLDSKLHRQEVPYRVYKYQRIPPLINRMPVKLQRTYVGSFSPHKATRNSHLPPRQTKLQTEELHTIRGELSQIKAQVDSLLERLEHMDQQRDQPAETKDSEVDRGPWSEGSLGGTTEPLQEPRSPESTEHRGQRAAAEVDSSENTDMEEQ